MQKRQADRHTGKEVEDMNNLASERVRAGLTQIEAAEKLDCNVTTLARYEHDPMSMSAAFIVKASQLYHCSCAYLLGVTPERVGS